jgi:hypothetical protein
VQFVQLIDHVHNIAFPKRRRRRLRARRRWWGGAGLWHGLACAVEVDGVLSRFGAETREQGTLDRGLRDQAFQRMSVACADERDERSRVRPKLGLGDKLACMRVSASRESGGWGGRRGQGARMSVELHTP